LKRDYEGAEVSARFGESTDGGDEQTQYTGVAGHNWVSGGFLVTGDISHNTQVRAKDRDYVSYLPVQRTSLYPENTQKSALFSGHQQIGSSAELTVDVFRTDRQTEYQYQSSAPNVGLIKADSKIWGVSPALEIAMPMEWELRIHGFVGRNETER